MARKVRLKKSQMIFELFSKMFYIAFHFHINIRIFPQKPRLFRIVFVLASTGLCFSDPNDFFVTTKYFNVFIVTETFVAIC